MTTAIPPDLDPIGPRFSLAQAAHKLGTTYWVLYGLVRFEFLQPRYGPNNRPYLTTEGIEQARRLLNLRKRAKGG
jgi:hypothetical protein